MRRLLLVMAVLVGLVTVAPTSRAGTGPCDGLPVTTQFVDAQSWWTTTPGKSGTSFGHVHLGTCTPERETLSSPIDLPTRVMLHDNPGKFAYVSVILKGTNYEKTVAKYPILDFTCPVGTCERWISVHLDPAQFSQSGLQEVRLRAYVDEPDKSRMTASLLWQSYVVSSAPKANVTRMPFVRGKGWYTNAGYCEASLPTVPLPDAPLSGTWSPTARVVDHGETGDLAVSRYDIRLDPDLHNGIPGTTVVQGSGQFLGPLSIDTTKLVNGPHKLMLRAECDDPRGSTNAGVLVIPFAVQNATATATVS